MIQDNSERSTIIYEDITENGAFLKRRIMSGEGEMSYYEK